MRTAAALTALVSLTLAACDPEINCGVFVYSAEMGRCTCPPGFMENDDLTDCIRIDAGVPPTDAATPDAGHCIPEECNDMDDDCDGVVDEDAGDTIYYRDADGDGRGDPANTITGCLNRNPTGYLAVGGDCDDRHPFGAEVCNGVDDDCDGAIDDGVCATTCTEVTNDGRVYSFCSEVGPWAGAAVACAGRGASLASIGSEAEHLFISGHITALGLPWTNQSAYIGGNDLDLDDVWTWVDGGPFWMGDHLGAPTGAAFAEWGADQPSGGRCAAYRDGRWVAIECDRTWPFICERPL